jgi:hypothetical protein
MTPLVQVSFGIQRGYSWVTNVQGGCAPRVKMVEWLLGEVD